MRWLTILQLRLRSLFRRSRLDRELDEELRFHFELQVRQNLAAGMSADEARYAALHQFGHPTQHAQECRDARRTGLFEGLLDDLRHAVRSLRRDPLLAFVAAVTLALSIGVNTAVFSVANSILIRPLPYPGSGRIDWISERSGPRREEIGAAPDYYSVRDQNRIFEDIAAFSPTTVNWTGIDRPEQLDAANVTASFFRVMGTRPLLGRYLGPDEEGTRAPMIAVASYAFWRNRLGSDPHVLGRTIALDRIPHTIIGVMPQGFDFPRSTDLWMPLRLDESSQRPLVPTRPVAIVSIIARRKSQVTPQQMQTEMGRLSDAVRAEYPPAFQQRGFRSGLRISAIPIQQHLTGRIRPALLVLTGAVALVVLIACADLAGLLFARAARRERELAVRLALGSGRARIIRQMLTEALVLATPGGFAGILLGWMAVRLLDVAKPGILVGYPRISVDWSVLAFSLGLTFATSLLFGTLPALFAARIRVQEALKSAGRAGGGSWTAARMRRALVVGELGISLVLLVAAGLLARSFLHLAHVQLGFPSDHLLTFQLNPVGPLDRDYTRLCLAVLERMQRLPLARSAALLSDMPLRDEDFYMTGRVRVIGRPPVPFTERPIVNQTVGSPEFFRTLGIPLLAGRIFDSHDALRSAPPVVVNEALARLIFPGEDPVGQRLLFGPDERNTIWTIVGVVGDVRGRALGADPPAMVYLCTCTGTRVFRAGFVIRTAGDPTAVTGVIQQEVRAVDRDQPIVDVKTMDQRRDAALGPERFQLILIGSLAAIAVVLAAAGVYGVMSYLVARRTREIGIRMAIGARPADIVRLIAGESTVLTFLALGAGLASAAALTRYISSMLFGISRLDAITFTVAPVLLALVVLAASLVPAHRAVRIDPTSALREE